MKNKQVRGPCGIDVTGRRGCPAESGRSSTSRMVYQAIARVTVIITVSLWCLCRDRAGSAFSSALPSLRRNMIRRNSPQLLVRAFM